MVQKVFWLRKFWCLKKCKLLNGKKKRDRGLKKKNKLYEKENGENS